MSSQPAASAPKHPPNGAALAAVLSAAIGSAALGVLVLLGATRIYSAPSLYAPVGGLSTRSTGAVVVWLIAWWLLHRKWKDRDLPAGRVAAWSLALVALSVLATFPPLWALLR